MPNRNPKRMGAHLDSARTPLHRIVRTKLLSFNSTAIPPAARVRSRGLELVTPPAFIAPQTRGLIVTMPDTMIADNRR